MRDLLDIVAYAVFFLGSMVLLILLVGIAYYALGWYGVAIIALLAVSDELPDLPLWMIRKRPWHKWFDRGALVIGAGLPLLGLLAALY